jgi:NADH-quinone oxidoreductase subunit G
MPTLKVNGNEVTVEPGMTVLQACEQAGAEIPRYCYHERLSIAGNCRMCLVEVSPGPPKPQASCALPAADKMEVKTDTPMVKKAREGVMEFLLINHPLDCPICDQGGECDLQDQAVAYGKGYSRYKEEKRSVKEKFLGPLIKTFMNRCIHCTRCIRFSTEIAGVEEMGATGRGEHMEIGTYIEKAITSELSGNLVDICPVGALTSKPYAYKARPWELRNTESIDVMDAVGSNILVGARGKEVMRILPLLNEDINEEWIADKTRHACDGLKNQRLDRPMIKENGRFREASWEEAYKIITEKVAKLKGEEIAAIAGDQADLESMFVLKNLMAELKSPNTECRQDGSNLTNESRASYIFNTTIAGIETADICLLIGTNPRLEAPIINARIRKRYLQGGFKVASIGERMDLTYPVSDLGNHPEILNEIASGKHAFAKILKAAKNPMIIVGNAVTCRDDGMAILSVVKKICDGFNVTYNLLHTAASRVGALDIGFLPGTEKNLLENMSGIKLAYLLGADEFNMEKLADAFVIYQGTHGDKGAHRADVILPAAAYTEKNSTYVNTEGRQQRARLAVSPPGMAKEDWKIIQELSELLGKKLPYANVKQIRTAIAKVIPQLAKIDTIEKAELRDFGVPGTLTNEPFASPIKNFYMTDPISRASKTMAECSAEIGKKAKEAA